MLVGHKMYILLWANTLLDTNKTSVPLLSLLEKKIPQEVLQGALLSNHSIYPLSYSVSYLRSKISPRRCSGCDVILDLRVKWSVRVWPYELNLH